MNFYRLTVADGGKQNEIMQTLRSNGIAFIQTSDGLCVKADLSKPSLEKLVGVGVSAVDRSNSELSPDIRIFLEN